MSGSEGEDPYTKEEEEIYTKKEVEEIVDERLKQKSTLANKKILGIASILLISLLAFPAVADVDIRDAGDLVLHNSDLNLGNNQIKNIGGTPCAPEEYVGGDGNCYSASGGGSEFVSKTYTDEITYPVSFDASGDHPQLGTNDEQIASGPTYEVHFNEKYLDDDQFSLSYGFQGSQDTHTVDNDTIGTTNDGSVYVRKGYEDTSLWYVGTYDKPYRLIKDSNGLIEGVRYQVGLQSTGGCREKKPSHCDYPDCEYSVRPVCASEFDDAYTSGTINGGVEINVEGVTAK
jgi:hypothetical protein